MNFEMNATTKDPDPTGRSSLPDWAEKGVTICLVAYNHAHFIRQGLDGLVHQTHPWIRIVACDDGSSDGTYEILKEYEARMGGRLRVLEHPGHANRGAYNTYKVCLEQVDTPYFVGQASDDFLEPDAVAHWVDLMEQHPEADVVYGQGRVVNEQGAPLHRYHGVEETGSIEDVLASCFERTPAFEPSMFYRANCLSILQQEPDLLYGDLYHNALLFKERKLLYDPLPVVNYRWHSGSSWQSIGRERLAQRRLQVLERYYERGVMAEYLRPQTFLLFSLLAAYSKAGAREKVEELKRALMSHLQQNPILFEMPAVMATAAQLSYLHNRHSHVTLLSMLPWATGRRVASHLPYRQITGQLVGWRESARPLDVLKVLLLVALNGINSLIAKNMAMTIARMLWPGRRKAPDLSEGERNAALSE